MSEQDYDPGEHKAPEVVDHLAEADEDEKHRVAAAELASDSPRKTVLAAAGVDEHTRMDASGRVLHGWETSPKPKG